MLRNPYRTLNQYWHLDAGAAHQSGVCVSRSPCVVPAAHLMLVGVLPGGHNDTARCGPVAVDQLDWFVVQQRVAAYHDLLIPFEVELGCDLGRRGWHDLDFKRGLNQLV
jgi:hypothetical protein